MIKGDKKMYNFKNFTDLKQKQITICQKLIPVGMTRKNIDIFNAMESDEYVSENKGEIRKLIKLLTREKMEEGISKAKSNLSFTKLLGLMNEYNETDSEHKMEVLERLFDERVRLANIIASEFKTKFSCADTITTLLPEYVNEHFNGSEKEEYLNLLEEVKKHQAMFNRFESNIDNMFSPMLKKGSVVYRMLVENTQIFLNNKSKTDKEDFKKIIDLSELDDETKSIIIKRCIDIDEESYAEVLIQEDIDGYNYCIGMLNSESKMFCDKNKLNYKDFELKNLYKAMLCEKTAFFEKIDSFKNDEQVVDSYNSLMSNINAKNIAKTYEKCMGHMDGMHIKPSALSFYSNVVYGKWNVVRNCIRAYCQDEMNSIKKNKKSLDDYYEAFIKKGITINQISNIVSSYAEELELKVFEKDLSDTIYSYLLHKYACVEEEKTPLKSDESKNAETIRVELEHCIQALRLLKIYDTENDNLNEEMKTLIDEIIDELSPAILLFNMTRNYITAKPTPKKKLALTFNTASFGGGWSESVESSKRVSLLKDDEGNKYLMIYNITGCKANNVSMVSVTEKVKVNLLNDKKNIDCYRKLVYSAVPDALKDISRLFINKLEDEEMIKRYKNKEHKENREFLNELISVLKEKINEHPTWSRYGFKFRDEYDSFDDFCDDINNQGYYAKWKYIPKTVIDEYVENGCIYLFKIYNNDYSAYKKAGSKVKTHTRYLDYLFSDENEKTALIKLLGGLEVFYREPQIKNPYVHKKGSILVNKKYKDGTIIGNEYKELFKKAQTTKLDNVYTRVCPYDIIKDKRYTMEQFEVHFPILIGNDNNPENFIEMSKHFVENAKHTVVVGRNRENLLYVSVYEENALIHSKSLNTVNGTNYRDKLFIIEDAKKNNARNWKTIGSNDALLTGYISAVIKDITDLVLKYNATLVIEMGSNLAKDRNLLPNRVYTKFKEALLHKLEFLIDSEKTDDEPGGLLHPYHLAEINKKNPKRSIDTPHNGIVLLVPSFYCGLTDPESNLCNLTYARTKKEKEEVLKKIKGFKYNKEESIFEFVYDMSLFNPNMKGKFTCTSNGDRLVDTENDKVVMDLTHYIEDKLKSLGIEYKSGNEINLISDDGLTNETLFNCIRYTLQMNNGNFFISPVTGFCYTCDGCSNISYNRNLYNRSKLVKENIKSGKKLKFMTIKDIYKPQS